MSNLAFVLIGPLVIVWLIPESRGLAWLWQIGKGKPRLWPFPH
jgi:hypothetical protein